MKRFVNVLIVAAFLIPLAVLCVPAYFGVLALSVPSARAEFLNHWALMGESVGEYEQGVLDQVDRYHPLNCPVTLGADVYSIPLPPGATPFENARHPRRPGRAQYLVRTAPFEAWRDDITQAPPGGFSAARLGSMLRITSTDGNVSVFVTNTAFARAYTILEVVAWGRRRVIGPAGLTKRAEPRMAARANPIDRIW